MISTGKISASITFLVITIVISVRGAEILPRNVLTLLHVQDVLLNTLHMNVILYVSNV